MIDDINLEYVKAGDTLIWHGRHSGDSRIVTVDRTTKTQIIFAGNKFRRSDGGLIGGSTWNCSCVNTPRPGEIEKVNTLRIQQRLVGKVYDGCKINLLREMSVDTLKQLLEVLENQ
jgi:hypothetical protein